MSDQKKAIALVMALLRSELIDADGCANVVMTILAVENQEVVPDSKAVKEDFWEGWQ